MTVQTGISAPGASVADHPPRILPDHGRRGARHRSARCFLVATFDGRGLGRYLCLTSELMQSDALPEMAMGDEKAPVTIIEYASMTCPHCAHFQETTFPEIKKRYIDTGKVRLDLPRVSARQPRGCRRFMLARCAGKDDNGKYFALIDTMFRQQQQWAVEKPIPPLLAIAKAGGPDRNKPSMPAWRISRCSTASKASANAPSTNSRCNQRPPFSSMGRNTLAPCRLDEMAKAD